MGEIGISKDYKDSPLGKIPVDWDVTTLGNEIKDLEAGVSVNSTDENIIASDLCILKTSSISGGEFIPDECKKISQKDIHRAKLNPQKDSIIISRMNTPDLVGECGYVSESYNNLFLPDRLWQTKFAQDSKVEVKWLNYILNTKDYKLKIKNVATGTSNSMKNISKSSFLSLKIPLPPQSEQRAIAFCLSTIDETIIKTNQLIAQKELRKKWLMQQLLSGKKRLKGFGGEWKEVRFGDVTKNFSRRKKGLADAKVYSVTNTNGFVLQSEHFEREIAGDDLSNYKIIMKNEFAYNPARINVGSIAFFKHEVGVISSLYVCFFTTKDILDYYLLQFLQLDHTKHRIGSLGEGGVRVYLWYDLFAKIKIKLPCLDEQTAIANVLQSADKEIQLLKAKAEKLKEEKKGMMQQLLTGKKRLKLII